MIKKKEMGICPFCGSDNVDYFDWDDNGDIRTHSVTCRSCGKDFTEYEKIIYDGYSYADEKGIFHDFDENGEKLN